MRGNEGWQLSLSKGATEKGKRELVDTLVGRARYPYFFLIEQVFEYRKNGVAVVESAALGWMVVVEAKKRRGDVRKEASSLAQPCQAHWAD